ncbi:MAG TPA: insulinase family protein [Candidatus Dormibacteraeota bacterium]|nr:insulinase family protein [Candidatus Dormibacteraeota bacterium]
MTHRLAAAFLALAFVAVPLGAGAATLHPARAIVETGDGPPLAAVELWFRAPSSGFAGPLVGLAQLAAESVAASQGHGEPLAALVQDRGGRLAIATFSDSVQVSALVPASSAVEIARAAFEDYTRPALTEDGFKHARASVAVEAAEAQADPDAQLRARLFGSLFSGGPDRFASLPTVAQLGALDYGDVVAFAKRAFRAENAVAVVVGVHDAAPVLEALGGSAKGEPAEPPAVSTPTSSPARIHGDSIAGPALGLAYAGPPIADRRAATAMDFLSDYLLARKTGTLVRAVAGVSPSASVGGQFITLNDPGILLVEVTGDASDAVRNAVESTLRTAEQPLDPKAFEIAQRQYVYHLLHDLQTVQAQADNLGWYAVEGAPSYAPFAGGEQGEYMTLARGLTPAYVAEMARRYFAATPAVTTLVPMPPAPPKAPGSAPQQEEKAK